ncbi:nucleoside triphosphate pyrophosphohydrolase [Clostridium tarantellae]|uniref:Phosphoribosyl-ATP pyrophosphohydrolase n=1 Tax=Clostridium tarantellae TaxID=39493 RepID=A0A6I1MUY3_9CLOT|nr:nucleoside triphosphate pyrophosphohydrolase [Clostridium tarantellae]MPQ44019.1 phosphoribosyl-ATP pyrophosphohydrolase [Clostridium tarantellae]
MVEYDKLVRDLIPDIINKSGKQCEYEIVSKDNKVKRLEEKLIEEVNEYLADKNLEELADIMEVLFALAKNLGYSEKDLFDKRLEKKINRGGFDKGIILTTIFK